MLRDDPETPDAATARASGVRREARYALAGLLVGIVVLPFAIYLGGAATLGPYEGGLGPFLANLYGDLAHLSPAALTLVTAPYVLGQALRWVTRPLRGRKD